MSCCQVCFTSSLYYSGLNIAKHFHKYLLLLIYFYKNVQLLPNTRGTLTGTEVHRSVRGRSIHGNKLTADVQRFFSHPNQYWLTCLEDSQLNSTALALFNASLQANCWQIQQVPFTGQIRLNSCSKMMDPIP